MEDNGMITHSKYDKDTKNFLTFCWLLNNTLSFFGTGANEVTVELDETNQGESSDTKTKNGKADKNRYSCMQFRN